MAISTYAELVTAAQNWFARSDTGFQARIPEAIAMTESLVNYGSDDREFPVPKLRARQMQERATLTVSSEYTALPSNFIEPIRMKIPGNPVKFLDYVTPLEFDQRYISSQTAEPKAFTIEGEFVRVGPSPDSSYSAELFHYRTIPALTASNTTNWLLTASPGIYLSGVSFHLMSYVKAAGTGTDNMLGGTTFWYRQFVGLVNGLNSASKASMVGGVLQSRPGVSPV